CVRRRAARIERRRVLPPHPCPGSLPRSPGFGAERCSRWRVVAHRSSHPRLLRLQSGQGFLPIPSEHQPRSGFSDRSAVEVLMSRLAVALALAAAWLAAAPQPGVQPALHAYHATKLSMDCKTCHVPVQHGSVTLRRPGHSQCVTCHAMAFRIGNNPRICQECHATPKPEGSADLLAYPRFKGLRPLLTEFAAARHGDKLARGDARTGFRADCSHRHKLAGDGKLAGLPQHAECAGCHSRPEIRPRLSAGATTSDCRACHSPEEIEKPSAQASSN